MRERLRRHWWVTGLAIAVLTVIVLAPRASSDPDGLNRVAEDHGFIASAHDAIVTVLPGYAIPGLGGDASKVIAGLIGVAIVFAVMMLLGRLLARRRKSSVDPGA